MIDKGTTGQVIESNVNRKIDELNKELEELNGLLSALESRLGPVLQVQKEEAKIPAVADESEHSPLFYRVGDTSDWVRRLQGKVRELLTRLDV